MDLWSIISIAAGIVLAIGLYPGLDIFLFGNRLKKKERSWTEAIKKAGLGEPELSFIHARWLAIVLRTERRIFRQGRCYRLIQTTTLIGGAIVPVLVSLKVNTTSIVALSVMVAISQILGQIFGFGDRYRHCRLFLNELECEGWTFLQRAAPYNTSDSLSAIYPTFAKQVEELARRQNEEYVVHLLREKVNGSTKAGPTTHLVTGSPSNLSPVQ